ncbi:hypothetical protein HMPREF1647_03720 [Lancefieldella parvula DNF00906]|uniref:hypothetical protein n=1 Tax=Lancefieldella parvula TaxID=1382 RepID=UPI00050DFA5B|nr:hypothetical protein [Lancefieldella parvula]KGF13881.1 hypothetical protein HMPREF1647_03720 [Lancefieldella parvula DNF00906]
METVNTLLGIVVSLLSIFATIQSYKNKKEIKRLYNLYEGNTQKAYGNGNNQIIGSDNRVVDHGE